VFHAQRAVVLFFKRILDFDKEAVAQREQRHAVRHIVEAGSPLQAALRLGNRDQAVRLLNLSSGGAAVQLVLLLEFSRGDPCQLRLELGGRVLRLDGHVAHQLSETTQTKLGVEFKFANFEEQKSYLQLLEPVAIGASLKPGNPKLVRQKEAGLLTKQYHGTSDTLLTVWRHFAGQAVHSFEFRMHDYFVRSSSKPKVLEIYTCEDQEHEQKQGYGVPALKRATDQREEIRQLFHWIVPHINHSVPDDIREYLAQF
jgi:hypothetical protein